MITMNSALTINKTGSSIIDDDEENRREKTSRPVTFTLGPSSSSLASISSLNLQQDLHHNKSLAQLPNDNIKYSRHSQSETIDIQRRRPIIEDPYRLSPNLQILNDWMITTTGKSRRELSQAHGFSEEQIAVFEESFSLLDKDGDGIITNYEIRSMMNSLGYSPSEEDIQAVISKIDIDGNGSVDFDEFLTMMRRRKSTGEIDTELQRVFDVFDKNRDGFIDQDELHDMLVRLGECLTREDIADMIEEADSLDHDGRVSYEEFKAILH